MTFLSVAEQLTGSRFGWVGEVNQNGRLDTIALSDPGWKSCKMEEEDSALLIRGMEIRGIWSGVLQAGEAEIINRPNEHPKSVGLPQGHPELTSFIGVPLKRLDKTYGMIALANKPEGYQDSDARTLERLSIPFGEALYRKRSEEELRRYRTHLEELVQERTREIEYEKRFSETTLESVPGIFYLFDEQGTFLRWNGNFQEVTGYSSEEMATARPLAFFEEEDRQRVAHAIQHSFSFGHTTVEAVMIGKDGRRTPHLFTGRRVMIEGKPCLVGMGIDITDRIRAEKALQQKSHDLGERVKEMTCLYRVSRLAEMSPSLEAVMQGTVDLIPAGWQFPELTCARISFRDREFRSEEYTEPLVTLVEDIVIRGERVGRVEVGYAGERVETDEGSFLKEERDLLQAIAGRLSLAIERKEAETALQHHTEALEKANAELEQFAYISSHHLQEPLRKIINYSQLLERRFKGRLDERADRYIYYVVDGANRMRSLIDDLLNYTRLDNAPPFKAPTNFTVLVQEILENLETLLQTSGSAVTLDCLPTLEVDAGEMRQVFHHLIENSIKFRRAEAPHIHVWAEKNKNYWVFSVKDNGIGIDPQFTGRIFGVFQRLHSPEQYPGTGMGLALCKKIVERHGGRIWVESEPEKGATFNFVISEV